MMLVVVVIVLRGEKMKYIGMVTGPGILIILSVVLSNLGIIPHDAPTYQAVRTYLLPAAVPLLLLGANIRKVKT